MSTRTFAGLCLLLLWAPSLPAQTRSVEIAWRDSDRSEPENTHYRTFESRLARSEVSYLVYLPPDYGTSVQRRYPVVYYLHGRGGTQRTGKCYVAVMDSAIRASQAPAVIIVLVNGLGYSRYCDSADGKWPVESVIIRELIPHVDQTYRTIARREARIIEGYSMGGFGAAHLGFKHPEMFGVIGIMSGALLEERMTDEKTPPTFHNMFGSDRNRLLAELPFTLLEKNADRIRGRTVIRVATGENDVLRPDSEALHAMLQRLEIEHEFEIVPGVDHRNCAFYAAVGERAGAYLPKTFSR